MEIGSKDLISDLPEAMICHILSFLSTKDAALTSVLSKRWRNLLAFVPNLDLDYSIYDNGDMSRRKRQDLRESFKLFVDRIMALQGDASVNKFSLRYEIGSEPSCVNGWILNVLERAVVDLDLYISPKYYCALPSEVFMSKTLIRLKLAGDFPTDVGEVFLPKLKTLYLEDIGFQDKGVAVAKLISGCHVLEELVMIDVIWGCWEYSSVSNPSLKRLTICNDFKDTLLESVSFDTPNLIYFKYNDVVSVKYPKANFDSLVELSLDLRMKDWQYSPSRDSSNATDFFMGICNVKILHLSAYTLKVLAFCCKAIPVFNSLIHLTIETVKNVGWESLPDLLENCPNLETLVFEGLHYKDTSEYWEGTRICKPWEGNPICLSSSPVKMLKVFNFGKTFDYNDDIEKEEKLIIYLLETMPNLEQVILYYDTPFEEDQSYFLADLQMLENVASPKCKVQLISDEISFSSILSSSSSTNEPIFFRNAFPV